jgi:hypothetical protein
MVKKNIGKHWKTMSRQMFCSYVVFSTSYAATLSPVQSSESTPGQWVHSKVADRETKAIKN